MSRLDAQMEARRRLMDLEGPGENPEVRAQFYRELNAWPEWSEWLPPSSPVLRDDQAAADWRQR